MNKFKSVGNVLCISLLTSLCGFTTFAAGSPELAQTKTPFDALLLHPDQLPEEILKEVELAKDRTTQLRVIRNHFDHLGPTMNGALKGLYATRALYHQGVEWSKERKDLHESIIREFLGKEDQFKPVTGSKPKILFTAGAPGSGKSTALSKLTDQGLFNKSDFVVIDQDEIRLKLPEYNQWNDKLKQFENEAKEKGIKWDPRIQARSSALTQAEATYICDLLFERAAALGKNIIKDGTLRNAPFFAKVINQIRNENQHKYEIGIVHIDVSEAKARERIKSRAEETGRDISESFFKSSSPERITDSSQKLKKLADFYVQLDNEGETKLVKCELNDSSGANAKHFLNEYNTLKAKYPKGVPDAAINAILSKILSPSRPNTVKTATSVESLDLAANIPLRECMSLLKVSKLRSTQSAPSSDNQCGGRRKKLDSEKAVTDLNTILKEIEAKCD
jgi:predicted ABC-type ATPase